MQPGTQLGSYEILSPLGKGGMGEVWRARDQKLGREVAIKTPPEEFAQDEERLARFEREDKLLASLNHPNIATIHGLEEDNGTRFLVLELVEGDTLANRLKSGATPVEESLKLALQIAEALEAAHEKGVIHRDLKPANIKVTPDGKIKVLDFGLAKAFAGDGSDVNLSQSPTLSMQATEQGVILGTAAYMSPEQARGQEVDKRADVWAFGVVLFEMLTGRGTFDGGTVSDVLAGVLAKEPQWNTLPLNLHPRIRLLLERCLEKEAKDRYGDISDARVDVQKVLIDPRGVIVEAPPEGDARVRSRLSSVAAVILVDLITGAAVWIFRPPPSGPVNRFTMLSLDGTEPEYVTMSPNGSLVAYQAGGQIFLHSTNEFEPRLLVESEEIPQRPILSPDAEWVAYHSASDQQLKKISVSGGAPVDLTATTGVFLGGTWSSDDTIVYTTFVLDTITSSIMAVSGNGGTPDLILECFCGPLQPQWIPEQDAVLVTSLPLSGDVDQGEIHLLPAGMTAQRLDESTRIIEGAFGRVLPTGHLVYFSNGALFAVGFDRENGTLSGGSVSLVNDARPGQVAVSETGSLVYVPGEGSTRGVQKLLTWVSLDGEAESIPAPPGLYSKPRVSPDGTRIAVVLGESENRDIHVWDIRRGTMTRLTFDDAVDNDPLWSKNSEEILFYSNRDPGGIYRKRADGTGEPELIESLPDRILAPASWSGDGNTLVTAEIVLKGGINLDIGAVSMDGERQWRSLLADSHAEFGPHVSPDGRWLVYSSGESLETEVYVRPFPEVDSGRWQVSTNSGNHAVWSPGGDELVYLVS